MSQTKNIIHIPKLQDRIFTIQGKQVLIDRDLAELYNVEVKRLNEQVKRNIDRFPPEFRFQVSDAEKTELVANCDRFVNLKHSSVNPYVFTEQGVSMLSAVLRSDTAIKVSISIINAFVEMRKFISSNATIFQRLEEIERKQIENDSNINSILDAIESREIKPKQGIFFDGQIFDAYTFLTNLIKSAKSSIIIIDNYIDDNVLTQLSQKNKKVDVFIYTKNINKQLRLSETKFNKQYKNLKIYQTSKFHDRFILIDNSNVYHIGASLKDLGNKVFAFSKIDSFSNSILDLIQKGNKQ